MSNKLPLADVCNLIIKDFNETEVQYKEKVEFYLSNRIHSRTLIAGSVGQEFEVGISTKANLGIKGTAKAVEKAAPALARSVAKPLLAIEIGAGIVGAVAGTLTVGGIAALGLAGAVTGGIIFAENRNKNRIRAKAKIYQNYFPREKSVVELFSQLLTLSVTKELEVIRTQPEAVRSRASSAKKTLHNAWKVAYGTKVDANEPEWQQQVKILSKTEIQKIWEVFKIFARQPEKYAEFAHSAKAKEMLVLFEKNCDLGDSQDKTKVINDWKINVFWLNVFASYLEGKGEAVRESVLSSLGSKLNVIPELPSSQIPSSVSLSSQCSSSSGIGSRDSLVAQAEIAYSPKFFVSKAAVLAANQPEPESSLNLNAHL